MIRRLRYALTMVGDIAKIINQTRKESIHVH